MRSANGASFRVHNQIAREIGVSIVSGRLRPGHVLDNELDASSRRHVSRTAYREALRILAAKGLIHSQPRHGTKVSEVSEWHLLDNDVLVWLFSETPKPEVIHGLFELRTIVETAAAAIAAARRKPDQLLEMKAALEEMARHTLHRAEGRRADKAFHAALLAATENPFLISLTNGVTAAVDALTEYKLRIAKVERDPVPDHRRVYEAVAAQDEVEARDAMERLIRLAILDMPASQRPRPLSPDSLPAIAYLLPASP
jgi:DNA-binding FadR family transcriptional regulator